MNDYIQRNLGVRAEFKTHINPIMVETLIFVRLPPILLCTTTPSPPQFASSHTQTPRKSPSPLLRDVGSNPNPAHSEMQTPLHPPLPFPEGCGRLDGGYGGGRGMGEGDTQGETQVVGGPSCVSPKRTAMNVVVCFLYSFLRSIQLTTFPPNASVTNMSE
jgi:hypothetical protein